MTPGRADRTRVVTVGASVTRSEGTVQAIDRGVRTQAQELLVAAALTKLNVSVVT